jgi:hypothetical protein
MLAYFQEATLHWTLALLNGQEGGMSFTDPDIESLSHRVFVVDSHA